MAVIRWQAETDRIIIEKVDRLMVWYLGGDQAKYGGNQEGNDSDNQCRIMVGKRKKWQAMVGNEGIRRQ